MKRLDSFDSFLIKKFFFFQTTRVTSRTYQFVQECNDQFPSVSNQQSPQLQQQQQHSQDTTVDERLERLMRQQLDEDEQKYEIYMDEHLAKHFISYILLLKRNISPNRAFFSPYE